MMTRLQESAPRGNEQALAALFERVGLDLRGEIERQIGDRYHNQFDAADILQVTFLEVLLHADTIDPGGSGSFRNWIRRIAENNLRDAIRTLERDKRITGDVLLFRILSWSVSRIEGELWAEAVGDAHRPSWGAVGCFAEDEVSQGLELGRGFGAVDARDTISREVNWNGAGITGASMRSECSNSLGLIQELFRQSPLRIQHFDADQAAVRIKIQHDGSGHRFHCPGHATRIYVREIDHSCIRVGVECDSNFHMSLAS